MAVAVRSKLSSSSVARSSRTVKVVCHAGAVERVQAAAASAVVAALLASPAHAGVVLQQPELKKLFQDDGSSAPAAVSSASKAAATKPAAKAPAPKAAAKEESSSVLGGDLDPRSVALPGSIVLVGAGLAAAYKLDAGFADFFREAMVKDSNNFAGYEPELKPEGGYVGTKKVKAGTVKKGGKK